MKVKEDAVPVREAAIRTGPFKLAKAMPWEASLTKNSIVPLSKSITIATRSLKPQEVPYDKLLAAE